ncbi:putative membrane protein [Metarhizium anisopliae]|nr:putative membrane protein [Metarhizium anisopliae]
MKVTNESELATATPTLERATESTQRWNTKNLGWRLAADAAGAACAGVLVAPVISIIDRSIMENASGRSSLLDSIRSSVRNFILRPGPALFSRPCALIFILYGGTYLTANALDTATSTATNKPATAISSGAGKFAASSAANVGLCMYKDRSFVRMFGPVGAPRAVPLPSYALFTLRDCLTIFASFNIPPLLAPYIDSRLSTEFKKHLSGQTAAQFIAPAAVQFLSTPLHLLGLDLYNRPGQSPAVSWRDRFQIVRSNWLISSAARVCRIVPAFGVGGVVNFKVRHSLMTKLE